MSGEEEIRRLED